MKYLLILAIFFQTRIASDFEIQQMQRQIERSRDFVSQLSARLNLGDLRLTRNERSLAKAEYTRAFEIATKERLEARRSSDMTRYATATSYAALAEAKLNKPVATFELLEEAMRYSADSAKSWNLYSSAMSILGKQQKAISTARNAVAIAERDLQKDPSVANRLDLAVYQYSLASAIGRTKEAEELLQRIVESLSRPEFDALRREVAAGEAFEIYSSARGDASAYLSLLNRAQLQLASLYEQRGEADRARAANERVLVARNDDPTALAALARLARSNEERERYFADAFDANPFSMTLIREYQRYLSSNTPVAPEGASTGVKMRVALQQMQRGDERAARATLDALITGFPSNDTLRTLRREAEMPSTIVPRVLSGDANSSPNAAELRQLIVLFADERLTPEQRAILDRSELTSEVVFDESSSPSVFESGAIDGVAFRFPEPIQFSGTFSAGVPLRLTYRILGATKLDDRDALLLEPIRLEGR